MKQYIEHERLDELLGVTLCFGEENISEDIKKQVEIYNATKRDVLGVDYMITEEDLVSAYKIRQNFDTTTQCWFAEKDGQTVGVAECYWYDHPIEGERVMRIGVNWRKEYFGTPLPDILFELTEGKCRQMAAEMQTDLTLVFSSWTMKSAEKRFKVFKTHGFSPERYFFNMTRDNNKELGEFALPEGIVIRKPEEHEYRKVFDMYKEAFKDHWGYQPTSEKEFESWPDEREFQPDLWKIAWDGDKVVGTVLNYVDEAENEENNRKRGYTETITVHRDYRGKGIAKAIIAESIRMFTAMDMEECALGVDAENTSGALKLYQHLGFEEDENETSIVLGKSFA